MNSLVTEPHDIPPGLVYTTACLFSQMLGGFPDDREQTFDSALAHSVEDEFGFFALFGISRDFLGELQNVPEAPPVILQTGPPRAG